jgi:hypothetical protein
MQGSRTGFYCRILFAVCAIIGVSRVAGAQDMPPILPLLTPPAAAAPAPTPPVAEAVIPPAVVAAPAAPAVRTHAAANHPAKAHHVAKSGAEKKRLAVAALHRHQSATHPASHRVALRTPAPALPPGMAMPPPGYDPPPGPYERFVQVGPPRGAYGWGGYRGPYPYFR